MKYILFSILLLTAYLGFSQGVYNPQKSGSSAAYNSSLATTGVPLDARAYYYDTIKKVLRPYAGTGEVLARFDANSRKGNFGIVINTGGALSTSTGQITGGNNEEWWFKNGVADSNLVQKTNNGTAVGAMVYASDVFNGNAIPARKGDILYNIIDDRTGEIISFQKITQYVDNTNIADNSSTSGYSNTGKVDSILVRKYGTEYFILTKDRLTAKDFGAKGDGATDDYAALQKAINVCSYWGRTLYITAGQYVFSRTLDLPFTFVRTNGLASPTPFFSLKLIGDGMHSTELKYTGAGNCIQAIGGTGNDGGGGIYDVTITGNGVLDNSGNVTTAPTSTGIYISGRGGFITWNCGFFNQKQGVVLNNTAANKFTEFVVLHNSNFLHCKTFLEYRVSNGGDASFHGSGLDGGLGNLDVGDTNCILINAGAVPYNAPMTLNFFTHSPNQTIINNASGGSGCGFYGHINVENYFLDAGFATAAKGQTVNYCGTVSSVSRLQSGSLNQTTAWIIDGATGTRILTSPMPVTIVDTIPAGQTWDALTKGQFWGENDGTRSFLATMKIMSADGSSTIDCEYLLLYTPSMQLNSTGTVKNISTIIERLPNGYNAPELNPFYDSWPTLSTTMANGATTWDKPVILTFQILPFSNSFKQTTRDIY